MIEFSGSNTKSFTKEILFSLLLMQMLLLRETLKINPTFSSNVEHNYILIAQKFI
jgi:hypothetical protein